MLTRSRTTPICPAPLGGVSSLPRTPRTFGGCPRPSELQVAAMGTVTWPRAEVVALPGAVLVVVAEESVVSGETGIVVEVVQLRSAPPLPPSSGAWAPAPRPRSRRLAGASGICSLWLGCFVRVLPPGPCRFLGPGQHPHCPSAGALAPAPSLSLSRWGPDLWAPAPRDPHWCIAGGPVRRQESGACGWGRPPATGPPGRPRPGSASTPGPMTAVPGPRTGPSPRSGGPGTRERTPRRSSPGPPPPAPSW
jgi:hypothetical protein